MICITDNPFVPPDTANLIEPIKKALKQQDATTLKLAIYGQERVKEKSIYLKQVRVTTDDAKMFASMLLQQLVRYEVEEVEDYDETESTEKGIYRKDPKKIDKTAEFQKIIDGKMGRELDNAKGREVARLDKLLFVTKFDNDLTGLSTIKKTNTMVKSKVWYLIADEIVMKPSFPDIIFEIPQFYFMIVYKGEHIIFDPMEYGEFFDLKEPLMNQIEAHSASYDALLSDKAPIFNYLTGQRFKEVKLFQANLDQVDQMARNIKKLPTANGRFRWGLRFTPDGKIDVQKSNFHGLLKCLRDAGLTSPITSNDYDVQRKKKIRPKDQDTK